MTKPSTCRFPALWKAPWPSCTASACVVRVPGLTIFICHTLLRVPHLRCTLMLLTVRPTLMHPLRSTTRVALSAFAPCRHLCPTTVPNPQRRSTERSWSVLQCWRHLPCPPPHPLAALHSWAYLSFTGNTCACLEQETSMGSSRTLCTCGRRSGRPRPSTATFGTETLWIGEWMATAPGLALRCTFCGLLSATSVAASDEAQGLLCSLLCP